MPKSTIPKTTAAPIMVRICEFTAESREIDPLELFSAERSRPEVAAARVLAMSVCRAAGIPTHTIAKAFGRTWQTVDSARETTIKRCASSAEACDEFIAILTRSLRP